MLSVEGRIIIRHTTAALDHYRSEYPKLSNKGLISSSSNSLIFHILEHGKMGDDTDLGEAIAETKILLEALNFAQKTRSFYLSLEKKQK